MTHTRIHKFTRSASTSVKKKKHNIIYNCMMYTGRFVAIPEEKNARDIKIFHSPYTREI